MKPEVLKACRQQLQDLAAGTKGLVPEVDKKTKSVKSISTLKVAVSEGTITLNGLLYEALQILADQSKTPVNAICLGGEGPTAGWEVSCKELHAVLAAAPSQL